MIGDIFSTGGQILPTIAINGLTGGIGGLPYLFSSAAGNAAAEARAGGASEDMAFTYGLLSGGLEAATEKMFDGIPGMKESAADDMIFPLADTDQGRIFLKGVSETIGRGLRSMENTEEDALLLNLWNDEDRSIGQTLWDTLPKAWHSALINTAANSVLNPFDLVKNYQDSGIVDAAMDTMQNGGTLSDAQLAEADAALSRLEGDGNNGWGNLPRDEWEAAKNTYLNK